MQLTDVVDSLVGQMNKTYDSKAIKQFDKGWKSPISYMDASLVKMEHLFDVLDGGEMGLFHEVFFQRVAEAEENENLMLIAADKTIKGLFDAQYSWREQKNMFSKSKQYDGLPEKMTKAQLIRVGLDTGNEDNYKKRMDGHKWSDGQMNIVKSLLTKKDWDFIQSVWDYIEKFKKPSFDLEERMTGRRPEEILAKEVETKFGTYRGGYFPISIDPEFSTAAQARLDTEKSLMYYTSNQSHAMTKHGHLTSRAATAGGQSLSTELSDITTHVTGVIHDLTHREAVVDMAKVLRDPTMDTSLRMHLGNDMAKAMMSWVKDIANTDPSKSGFEKAAKGVRMGTTVMMLGTFGVVLQQLAGFTQSVHGLGKDSWRLLPAILHNPVTFIKDVTEKSAFMKTRISHYNREAHDAFKGLSVYKSIPAASGQFAMNAIGVVQFLTDMPTWKAAYDVSFAKDGDERRAVKAADRLVRMTQGGGGVKDLAAVQRGNEYLRTMTMFYSFMNLAYNIFTAPGRGKGFRFGEMTSALLFVGLLGPMAAELLSGRPPDEDDDENWAAWAAKIEGRFFSGLLPIFRDLASPVLSGFDYRVSPIESAFNVTGKGIGQAIRKKDITKLGKPAAEIGGMFLRMPTHQMLKTGETFFDWWYGDPDIEIQEFMYGRKK